MRRSLLGDLLVFADAGYVRVLRIGAVLAEAGIVIALGAIFGGLGLAAVLSGTDLMRWLEFDVAVWAVAVVGGLGFGFLTLAGWVMLSWPDPGRLVDSGVTARKVVRWGVVTTALAWTIGVAVGTTEFVMMGGWVWVPRLVLTILDGLAWVGGAGVVVQLLGASAYMEHMARRVKCAAMGKAARDVRWLTIATLGVGGMAALMVWQWHSLLSLVPMAAGYGCFALTAGKYASVVDLARREIGLAGRVIASGGRGG